MSLFIGISLICIVALWLAVLLIGGRNPAPPWWASDWMLADIQVPSLMVLATFAIWYIGRFLSDPTPWTYIGVAEGAAALGMVVGTVVIIRKMEVGRHLRTFAEMEDASDETNRGQAKQSCSLRPGKLPWQVRLHLAERMNLDSAEIRRLRCFILPITDSADHLRFMVFDPGQANAQSVAVNTPESLAAHPDLVLVSGYFASGSQGVTVDQPRPRRAA